MTIAVNRKSVNQGCPDGTGKWLFEDFLFGESVFGRAEVTYEVTTKRHEGWPSFEDTRVRTIPAESIAFQWIASADTGLQSIIIHNVEVADVVVFDDDGNVIPLKLEQVEVLKKMVLEAFAAVETNVIEHVRSQQ